MHWAFLGRISILFESIMEYFKKKYIWIIWKRIYFQFDSHIFDFFHLRHPFFRSLRRKIFFSSCFENILKNSINENVKCTWRAVNFCVQFPSEKILFALFCDWKQLFLLLRWAINDNPNNESFCLFISNGTRIRQKSVNYFRQKKNWTMYPICLYTLHWIYRV